MHLIYNNVVILDINECERDLIECEFGEKCENYDGGARCICGDGFQQDSNGKCVGQYIF